MRKALSLASWGYLILALGAWLLLKYGDSWWLATMVLFGPRWVVTIPLAVLLPFVVWVNRKLLFPLIAAAMVVAGPFTGLCLPLKRTSCNCNQELRVLTSNLNAGDFAPSALASLIRDAGCDIVALQECPRELRLTLPPGWQMLREGELAIASRYPLFPGGSLQAIHPPHKWPRASFLHGVVRAPRGDVAFCTVHLPSPRYGLQNILDRRTLLSVSRKGLLDAETVQRAQTSQEIQRIVRSISGPVIVAGDFNMPVESSIYRRYWGGFANAFSKVGIGYGWTERSTVKGIEVGVRVDHVLTGAGLVPCACEAGPDVGSDHLPLLAAICRVSGNFP